MVDLFTRETILAHLNTRTQDNVAKTKIRNIIFQRGVPRSLRTDNAPELSSLNRSRFCDMQILKNRSDKDRRTQPEGQLHM